MCIAGNSSSENNSAGNFRIESVFPWDGNVGDPVVGHCEVHEPRRKLQ